MTKAIATHSLSINILGGSSWAEIFTGAERLARQNWETILTNTKVSEYSSFMASDDYVLHATNFDTGFIYIYIYFKISQLVDVSEIFQTRHDDDDVHSDFRLKPDLA